MTGTPVQLRDRGGRVVFEGTQDGGGGSQPDGVLTSADVLFTEHATVGADNFAVTAVSVIDGSFGIAGDHTAAFAVGTPFVCFGSSNNDGDYVVQSVSFAAGTTTIVCPSGPGDATADGTLYLASYTASLPILAGSLVVNFAVIGEGNWAADVAELSIGDTLNGPQSYAKNFDLTNFGTGVYNPADSGTFDLQGGGSMTQVSSGVYGTAAALDWSATNQGVGVPYAADDALTFQVITALASSPVVPGGVTRIKVMYFTPITAVAATFA